MGIVSSLNQHIRDGDIRPQHYLKFAMNMNGIITALKAVGNLSIGSGFLLGVAGYCAKAAAWMNENVGVAAWAATLGGFVIRGVSMWLDERRKDREENE